MLIVLSGKTASGKDTIQLRLLEKFPNLKRVITTTSRTPRENEVDGFDYHFIEKEEFLRKINSNEFVEYVEYGGNFYGTQRKELEQAFSTDLIWRIDPSYAGKVKDLAQKITDEIIVIFVTTSDEVILERLKKRNMSSEEIKKRMDDDKRFMDTYNKNYDYVIENIPGKLSETIDKIAQIIENHKF